MLILILAMLAQDPNTTYQNLDRAAKERVYLVYDREVRARQNVDESVEATSKATSYPGGTIRLVVFEMKRDPKFIEQRKTANRGLLGKKEDSDKKKTSTRPRAGGLPSGGGGIPGAGRKPRPEKKYSGDGITKVEGVEKVKFGGKDQDILEFHRLCRFVLPNDLESVNEKVAVVVDGVVKSIAKDWLVIDAVDSNGNPATSIVVLRIPSTDRMDGIHKGDEVRLWGFFADQAQIKSAEDVLKDKKEDDKKDAKKATMTKKRRKEYVKKTHDLPAASTL